MSRTPFRLTLLAAALLLAASAHPAAAGPGFDVGARGVYWFPSVSGDVDTGDGKIDLESDLGLDDEDFLGAEAFARVAWFGARAGYMPIKFDATNTLPGDITFEGVTFPEGTDVSTEVELKTADLELAFAPRLTVPWLANAQLGLLVKGKFVDGTVTLSTTGTRVEQDLKGVVPMVGLLAGAGSRGTAFSGRRTAFSGRRTAFGAGRTPGRWMAPLFGGTRFRGRRRGLLTSNRKFRGLGRTAPRSLRVSRGLSLCFG